VNAESQHEEKTPMILTEGFWTRFHRCEGGQLVSVWMMTIMIMLSVFMGTIRDHNHAAYDQ
jgi:hypothetical protein